MYGSCTITCNYTHTIACDDIKSNTEGTSNGNIYSCLFISLILFPYPLIFFPHPISPYLVIHDSRDDSSFPPTFKVKFL